MNPRPKDAATDAAAVHVTGTKQHECLISPCGQDSSIGFRVRVWGYAGCRLAQLGYRVGLLLEVGLCRCGCC
jgi:hypothetical protein